MFLNWSVELENAELLDQYAELFQRSPQLLSVITAKVADKYAARIEAIAKAEPGPAHYPILWASLRQQIAFYASNGFGRGIPTIRTHDTARKSKVVVTQGTTTAPASIGVESGSTYDKFVRGYAQQPFHARTGWVKMQPALAVIQESMVTEYGDLFEQAYKMEQS